MEEKAAFLRFLRTARTNGRGAFTKEERERYLAWLDLCIRTPMDFSRYEIQIIFAYIERSMVFYLNICARGLLPRDSYRGCMENLIFLTGYLLHYYRYRVSKENLESLSRIASDTARFAPVDINEWAAYLADTGVLKNIHFFMDYYYPE